MEIVVHGTKQGYKGSFIPNFQPSFALGDIRNGVNNENPLGKSVYSLAHVNGGCVYTKYTILRDTLRAFATGNIAFSIFLPANKELSGKGADVKSMLDKLSSYYINNYIRDSNMNQGITTLIQEDWSFVKDISNEFIEQNKSSREEEITSGLADPAFHYYKTDNELIEHFDKPFQEEYSDYKQILFIDSNLQGNTNPLNVLKNSGVEVNPDLENAFYKLREFHGNGQYGVEIKIKNSKNRELHNKDKVYRKEELTVVLSKKYYQEKRIIGSLLNNEELRKYLVVSSDSKIDVVKEVKLEPETKKIIFKVIQPNGLEVDCAEVQVDEGRWESRLYIKFSAEEIGKAHKITARKGTDLFSDEANIIPNDIKDGILTLMLKEQKVVEISVYDEESDNKYVDFKISVSDGKFSSQSASKVTFRGDELNKSWNITVEKEGFVCSSPLSYNPRTDNDKITFKIKRTQKQIPTDKKFHNIASSIKNDEKQNSFVAKINAFFSNHKVIISVVSIFVLALVIWARTSLIGYNKQTLLTAQQIEDYVEGDILMYDQLKSYQADWEKQMPEIETFGGKEWYNPTNWFADNNEAVLDSSNFKEWDKSHESIKRAIEKRNMLNSKDFAELRDQRYSNNQLSLKDAIKKIDSTQFEKVGKELGDVSTLTLKQIELKINEILKLKELTIEETLKERKREDEVQVKKNEQFNIKPNPQELKPSLNNKDTEIKKYIKGGELDLAKLEEYKNQKDLNQDLKNSIQLCLYFWALDGVGSDKNANTYRNLQQKVNTDPNFKDSKLKIFLDKMCQEGAKYSYDKTFKRKELK